MEHRHATVSPPSQDEKANNPAQYNVPKKRDITQKQLEEANDIIVSLENKPRWSPAKRKELALQLSESNETIEEHSGQSGSDEVEEAVSELMEKNQILTDQISNLKREEEGNH